MRTHAVNAVSRERRGKRRRRSGTPLALLTGIAATTVVAVLWAVSLLDAPEGFLLDKRWVYATRHAPPITNRVTHVDIDEISLEQVGRWPWDRELLALTIDAISAGGAKTIVLDLQLSEAQKPRLRRAGEGIQEVHDDTTLADAFARAGNVLIGANATERKYPVPELEHAAAGLGFVDAGTLGEGAVRFLPATRTADGRHIVQLGIAAAAHALDIPKTEVRSDGDTIRFGDRSLPMRDGLLMVPWHTRRDGRDGPATWTDETGLRSWLRIHKHQPIGPLVEDGRNLRVAVAVLNDTPDREGPPTPEELASARDNAAFYLSMYEQEPAERVVERLMREIEAAPEDARAPLEHELSIVRAAVFLQDLRRAFENKVVFIGWQASGALADYYPTAMATRTPGVTVHAAVTSGILSGHWKVRTPAVVDGLLIVALGLAATAIASTLPVGVASSVIALIAVGYAALNALVLFDRVGIVAHAAGPLAAIAAAWALCTAVRAIQEAREKGAIRRQFRSRVSAQLVDYLAENPDLMNMEGEEREVTTMFTDFVGFTSISESLEGTATVKLLNVYLGEIAEALMQEGAYVNKFLGDGIMAFWGAPVDQPDHAARACRAAIAAVATLERVNNLPEYKDLPKLGMRLGISTGTAIVGDCGAPPKLNDYTVIGDPVNLAARLESANKLLGTRILVTARTRELMGDAERASFAWRPIGLIRVVGQQKPSEIWELLGRHAAVEHDAAMRTWIEQTTRAVELFQAGYYAESMALWQDLVLFERGHAGALLYVERCAELIESGQKDPALPLRSK